MILTGILITALSIIFMFVSIITAIVGGESNDGIFAGGMIAYIVCVFGYIIGLTLIAIGIFSNLGWI